MRRNSLRLRVGISRKHASRGSVRKHASTSPTRPLCNVGSLPSWEMVTAPPQTNRDTTLQLSRRCPSALASRRSHDLLDKFRRTRNLNDYSGDVVSEEEAAACIRSAEALLSTLTNWLKQ